MPDSIDVTLRPVLKLVSKWQFWAVILIIIGLIFAEWIALPVIRWLLRLVGYPI